MEINASASLTLQIAGGPTVSTPWTMAADAFDRATIKVPKNTTTPLELLLQPADGDNILLMVITSTLYSNAVTYELAVKGTEFKLAQPQIISGSDLISAISKTPSTVAFKNTGPDDAIVDLIVLRRG